MIISLENAYVSKKGVFVIKKRFKIPIDNFFSCIFTTNIIKWEFMSKIIAIANQKMLILREMLPLVWDLTFRN